MDSLHILRGPEKCYQAWFPASKEQIWETPVSFGSDFRLWLQVNVLTLAPTLTPGDKKVGTLTPSPATLDSASDSYSDSIQITEKDESHIHLVSWQGVDHLTPFEESRVVVFGTSAWLLFKSHHDSALVFSACNFHNSKPRCAPGSLTSDSPLVWCLHILMKGSEVKLLSLQLITKKLENL